MRKFMGINELCWSSLVKNSGSSFSAERYSIASSIVLNNDSSATATTIAREDFYI